MKKYLILTVTAGNGHNSAANAVKESLETNGAEAKVVDLLHEYCDSKTFIWIQEKGYALACQYLVGVFNAFFRHYQKSNPKKYYKSPVQLGIMDLYDKLLNLINEYKPDAIYCSHFLPCVMITNLRKLYPIPAKVYSFVFDYAVCPFWEAATGIDYLLVPNEKYYAIMIEKGFKQEQLLPYGLTVNEKFSKKIDKRQAREQLGLKDDVFTVLVMFGGGFWSGNYKIVKNLIKHIKGRSLQIVVANGRDEKSKKKIDKLKYDNSIKIINYGFSKNVDVLMSAADVIVGKAGGVSVTESLNKYPPMICCKKLPEQEKVNVNMLVSEGAARQYKNDKMLINVISELLNNPRQLIIMRENVARIRRPDATSNLVRDMLAVETDYSSVSDVDYSLVNAQIKRMLKKGKGNPVVEKPKKSNSQKNAKKAEAN